MVYRCPKIFWNEVRFDSNDLEEIIITNVIWSFHILVLLYPEDHDYTACINVLKSREKRMAENGLVSNIAARDSKVQNPKRKVFNSDLVYPHASLVAPKIETMNLSSGTAEVTRRADCWMTYEEYCKLTR